MEIGNKAFEWGTKTFIMGVLNVTPDSFSGDGTSGNIQHAMDQAQRFQEFGADILDVGGESTRPASLYPNSIPVSAEEELDRVLPVIEALHDGLDIPISIDTSKSWVAKQAIAAGAEMVNDVWGLVNDRRMRELISDTGVPVVLVHNQTHTNYNNVVVNVIQRLTQLLDNAIQAGIPKKQIILDPGIGFGKTTQQSLQILRRLREFRVLGMPILVGPSRKSIIGSVLDLPVQDRLEGTAATVAISIANGADIIRVHDVKEMARVAKMTDAIVRG